MERVAIKDLTLDPNNARKHSERNLKAIAASLEKFGQRKPIVIHGSTVIAGNGIEIDPTYVDVIVKRLENETGLTAEKVK